MSHRRFVNPARLPGVGDCWGPQDDTGLQACPECDGSLVVDGEPCWYCQHPKDGEPRGYFLGDMPMNAREYQQLAEEAAS